MRRLITRLLPLFVLFLAAVARAESLADRVPADALVYVGWEGADKIKPAYAGSHLKAVVDASTLPEFFEKTLPELVRRGSGAPEAVDRVMAVLAVAWKNPTVVYVGQMDLKAIPPRPPVPRIAIVCDAGAGAEALHTKLTEILAAGGTSVPMAARRNGGRVMLEIGQVGEQATAMLLGGPVDANWTITPLSADTAFTAAVAQLGKAPALTVYVSATGLVKLGDAVAAAAGNTDWPAVRDALALGNVRSAALTAGFDGKDWRVDAFVAATGPREGLLALLKSDPLDDAAFRVIPENATWAGAAKFDLAKLFSEITTLIPKIDPRAKQDVEQGLAQANRALGVNIEKDLLGSLGDTWTAYTAPTVGGNSMFGLVIVNTPKDAPRLSDAIDNIEAKANAALRQNGGDVKFAIRRTTLAGIEVHHIPVFIASPSWAIRDGRLFVALSPHSIPGAVEAATAKTSILDNPAFKAVRQRLGVAKPSSLLFIDLPKTAPDMYAFVAMISAMGQTFANDAAPASLLPPLNKLMAELAPAGMATWSDDAGWHFRSVSPMPGSFILGGQQGMLATSPAMMAAVLLPSLGRARELSNRSYSAANLRGIAQSANVWAADHNDQFPDHVAQLVAGNYCSPKQLVSKRHGNTEPATFTPDEREAANLDWTKMADKLDAHCDYVLILKGQKAWVDSTVLVGWEKPEGVSDGINMAFSDAHAEFVRFGPALRAVVEAHNRAAKQYNFKTIDLDDRGFPIPPK